MKIIAIDPGNIKSAFIIYEDGKILEHGLVYNEDLRMLLYQDYQPGDFFEMVIEMIACYGMPVGKEVFDTCLWIGRFMETWSSQCQLVYRKDIKIHLCGTVRAKDANVRQALIDRHEPTGGGKVPQIGTKQKPGPLYGIKKDVWSALAVAVYYDDNAEIL